MTADKHHFDALIATAKLELERAHRGALSIEAGEIRRGLELALTALREATGEAAETKEAAAPEPTTLAELQATLTTALAELDGGQLSGMEANIEAARQRLDAATS